MEAASGGSAVLWWIGVVVLFLVVIPLVLILVQQVLRRLREIKDYSADVLEHGLSVTKNLEPVPVLVETGDLVKRVGNGLGRYFGAVDKML